MSKTQLKPSTLIAPLPPIMVSCGSMEQSNIITVAWTGVINTAPPKTYIAVRPERHSYNIIKESGEFVINLTTARLTETADFCGFRSGRTVNKFEVRCLTREAIEGVTCPAIKESPVNLACKVTEIKELGSHHLFLADILNVTVDDSIIDHNGKIRFDRADIAAYMHGEYYRIGDVLGRFGYSIMGKKPRADHDREIARRNKTALKPNNKI